MKPGLTPVVWRGTAMIPAFAGGKFKAASLSPSAVAANAGFVCKMFSSSKKAN